MIKNYLLKFFNNINIKNYDNIYVAYSGGLDSTVLLHALYNINISIFYLHNNKLNI